MYDVIANPLSMYGSYWYYIMHWKDNIQLYVCCNVLVLGFVRLSDDVQTE